MFYGVIRAILFIFDNLYFVKYGLPPPSKVSTPSNISEWSLTSTIMDGVQNKIPPSLLISLAIYFLSPAKKLGGPLRLQLLIYTWQTWESPHSFPHTHMHTAHTEGRYLQPTGHSSPELTIRQHHLSR